MDSFYSNRDVVVWVKEHNIDKSLLTIIRDELNKLFEKNDTDIVMDSKLYARLSILYGSKLNELGEINNKSGIFKICSVFLNDMYCCDHYISTKPIANRNSESIIEEYVRSLDVFTVENLNNYCDNMHLKRPINYVSFMENLCDSFVLVDFDTAVSASVFPITDEIRDEIESELIYYIKSFGKIDSDSFNDFKCLPKIGNYVWNKFLLLGIVRTYLFPKLLINNINGTYKTIRYTISIK